MQYQALKGIQNSAIFCKFIGRKFRRFYCKVFVSIYFDSDPFFGIM